MIDSATLPGSLQSSESVKRFYLARDGQAFWVTSAGMRAVADSLLAFVKNIDRFGLNPSDYHVDQLASLLNDSLNAERYALADPLLTDAWLTLHNHLKRGRLDPKTLQRLDVASAVNEEAVTSLQQADNHSVLSRLRAGEPGHDQYHKLKNQLQSFMLLAQRDSVQRARALTLALNLERWRWQKPLPDRYLSVNIPSFVLRAVEDDSVWLETRVAGDPCDRRQTRDADAGD